jgi:Ran GTPase-activating protein (RanGAP) involved in mRNA processing and transport
MQRLNPSPTHRPKIRIEAGQPTARPDAETLRQHTLPPREGNFDASDLEPGYVKSFFLDGDVPADAYAQAEIEHACLKNRQSLALAWLFLKLEKFLPGTQQSLQLAFTGDDPRKQPLDSTDAEFLARWLDKWISSLPLLATVNLRNNSIGNTGARALAELLARNPPLRHLIVSSCDMSDEGVRSIAEALLHNTELQSLDISGSGVEEPGLSALAQVVARTDCPLLALDLSYLHGGTHHGEHFTGPFEDGLEKNRSLQHLGFARTPLSPKMKHILQAHPTLTSVNLKLSTLDSRAVTALTKNHHLESFDLSYCELTERAAEALLCGLKLSESVRHVDLRGNRLENHGPLIAGLITGNPQLSSLNLSSCGLSADDVNVVLDAAGESKTLQALNLLGNVRTFLQKDETLLNQRLLLNKAGDLRT